MKEASARYISTTLADRQNWSVPQMTIYDSVVPYIDDARARSIIFGDMLRDFATHYDFQLNHMVAEPKSEESANRKVFDRTSIHSAHFGHPEFIKDYGRGKMTVPAGSDGIERLDQVMADLIHSPFTVGYKNQFLIPNPETGYRSFKAIWDVDGMNFEVLVEYGGMSLADNFTKKVREIERSFKALEPDINRRCTERWDGDAQRKAAKWTTQMEMAIQAMRDGRKGISELYADNCGLNELVDPATLVDHNSVIASNFLKAAKATKGAYGRPVIALIEQAELQLPERHI